MSHLLHPFAPPTKTEFLRIVRGDGSRVWDSAGNEYIDAIAALWFVNVGYGRREVVEAIATQAQMLHAYHCFDPFTVEPAEALAERIAAIAPLENPRVFFTNSGSDAVDSALKISRAAHALVGEPRRGIVVSHAGGYHGTNLGGTSASGIEMNRDGWGALLDDHLVVPREDLAALERVFVEHEGRIAAVITEPVQGAGGVHPAPDDHLSAIRALCDAHGAFMIVDEVICGFGRLGTWFGSIRYGVRPDMITIAKAVTSGYQPLGGVVIGAAVRAALEEDPGYLLRTGYTFSGHATACAAGLACLDVTEREDLLGAAHRLGSRLRAGLDDLVSDGLYRGNRGKGFIMALEMLEHQQPAEMRDALLGEGVIARPLPDCLAFCPPLVTSESQIDQIVDALRRIAKD